MCDNRTMWNYSSSNTDFYHQYLQEHARMTQWIQNLHQYLPHPWQSFSNRETQMYQHQQQELCIPEQRYCIPEQGYSIPQQEHYIPHQGHIPHQRHTPYQGRHIPYQGHHIPHQGHYIPKQRQTSQHVQHQMHSFKHHENSRHNSHNPYHRSRSHTSAEYVSDYETDVRNNEDEDSDGEWVLNVDAILKFRDTKDESEKEEDAKSEESIEFVDTVLNENFEFVELDDAGQMQKVIGRKTAPDANGNSEYNREARIVLFGDRADRIAGLETSLEIMFDHINDLHQPVVYPHA